VHPRLVMQQLSDFASPPDLPVVTKSTVPQTSYPSRQLEMGIVLDEMCTSSDL